MVVIKINCSICYMIGVETNTGHVNVCFLLNIQDHSYTLQTLRHFHVNNIMYTHTHTHINRQVMVFFLAYCTWIDITNQTTIRMRMVPSYLSISTSLPSKVQKKVTKLKYCCCSCIPTFTVSALLLLSSS